jgi:alkyl hydroperoxide reductase subunit AhpC
LAPEFSLPVTQGQGTTQRQVKLGDYRGRWLILVFYPRDFSMVCPTELTALSTRIEEFVRRECEVLGVSTDSVQTHERWIAAPRSQNGLGGIGFPLAADEAGTVCRTYGVYHPRRRVALRGLFIIDPNGVLQYQVVHNLSVGRRTDEILRVLDALQTGGLCPESWTPEDATLDPARSLGPDSVIGQYRIHERIGTGTFSSVFRASDTTLQRTVALKVLKPGNATTPDTLLAEARLAAALNHPNVCTIFAADSSEGVSLIAMEYVAGQPLSRFLEAGRLPTDQAASVAGQVARGMAAAHTRGIIHGDLKPANIMVEPDGRVKIMDFGLARRGFTALSEETALWDPEAPPGIAGTPRYMSPEQARGEPLTPASDVFSLGLVVYEMATGRRAIPGDNILDVLRSIDGVNADQYAAELPEPFARIVRQALVQDAARRLLTMAAIAAMLE